MFNIRVESPLNVCLEDIKFKHQSKGNLKWQGCNNETVRLTAQKFISKWKLSCEKH